jgi:hypothetical protein
VVPRFRECCHPGQGPERQALTRMAPSITSEATDDDGERGLGGVWWVQVL